MARMNLDNLQLDSTGRTQRNGGIMPPTPPFKPVSLAAPIPPTQAVSTPAVPVQPAVTAPTPAVQPAPGTVQALPLSNPAQTAAPAAQPATPPGVQTAIPQAQPTPLQLPAIDGSGYYAGTGTPVNSGYTATPVSVGATPTSQVPTLGAPTTLPNAAGSGTTVQGFLNNLLKENGSYLQDAARRGLEVAGGRGLLNSSIAAGASTRSALEAAQPILDQIVNVNNNRENMAFTQGENALNRTQQERLQALDLNFQGGQNDAQRQLQAQLQAQGYSFEDAQNTANRAFQGQQASLDRAQSVNNSLLQSQLAERMAQVNANIGANAAQQDFQFRRTLQSDATAQQDWLATNQFNNQFNANLSLVPISNSMQMLQQLSQYALQDPETFTPDVMSGFTTFFNNNMVNLLDQYFPNQGGNS